jgi:hypothetical protein
VNSCNANELCLRFFLALSRNVTRIQKSLACRAGRKKMKGQVLAAPRQPPRAQPTSVGKQPGPMPRRLARLQRASPRPSGPPPCISSDELKNS